jgi:hypothetical protein
LVHEVIISIQFIEGLFQHFQLEIKVHSHWTIEAYQAGVHLNSDVLPFGTRRVARTTKIDAVSGDERPIPIDDEAF